MPSNVSVVVGKYFYFLRVHSDLPCGEVTKVCWHTCRRQRRSLCREELTSASAGPRAWGRRELPDQRTTRSGPLSPPSRPFHGVILTLSGCRSSTTSGLKVERIRTNFGSSSLADPSQSQSCIGNSLIRTWLRLYQSGDPRRNRSFTLLRATKKGIGSVARRCVTATTRGEGALLGWGHSGREGRRVRGASALPGGTTDLDRGRLGRQEIRLRSTTPYRKLGTAPSKLVGGLGGWRRVPTHAVTLSRLATATLRSLPRRGVSLCAVCVCVCVECEICVWLAPPIACS